MLSLGRPQIQILLETHDGVATYLPFDISWCCLQTNVTGGTSSQRICQTRNTKWKTRNYGAGNQDSSHCPNSQVCTYTQTIIQLTLPVIIVTVVAIIIIAIVIIIDIADHHNLHHHLNHHHHHHHIIVIIIITLSLHINL